MVRKYWYLIVAVVVGLVLLFTGLPQRNPLPGVPVCGPGEIMVELDTNDDGNTDFWAFLDQDSVPVGSVGDTNFDGKPDSWSHFKNGRAFLEQEDTNNDGTIDLIIVNLFNEDESKIRSILLLRVLVQDMGDIFFEAEDTGWVECGTTFQHQRNSQPDPDYFESFESVSESDRNDDGSNDTWVYMDRNNVPGHMILDTNFDGRPDTWEIFKNGRPFLGQDDQDYDGTIDYLLIQVHDEARKISRAIIFILEENLFVEDFDSGWVDEEEFL